MKKNISIEITIKLDTEEFKKIILDIYKNQRRG